MTVIRSKIVKTRKNQTCWGCCEKFDKGVKLRYQVDVDSNSINCSYWCKVCDVTLLDCYEEQVDCGIGFGDVKDYYNWYENSQKVEKTY